MGSVRRPVSRETIAEAKRRYETTTAPLGEIAALLGVSITTLRRRVAEWGWVKRQWPRKGVTEPPAQTERATLVERIQAVAEREICAVEQILATLSGADAPESEGAARTLASLARTLRELVQLDVTIKPPEAQHDEPAPRDIDELRRSLADKMDRLVAARAEHVSDGA